MSEGVGSDASTSVGVDKSLVEVGFFGRSESRSGGAVSGSLTAANHEAKKAVECDEISAERVIGVFAVDDFGKVEGVDANVRV